MLALATPSATHHTPSLPGEVADAQQVSFAQEKKFIYKQGRKLIPLGLHDQASCAE